MTWMFRIYNRNGTIAHEFRTLDEAVREAAIEAEVAAETEPGTTTVIGISLADRRYDYPDYNPQTGEEYEGVLNDSEILVGSVYVLDGTTYYEVGDRRYPVSDGVIAAY